MASPPPRGAFLELGGPNWLGNLFHNILCGVLIVQVYIYYASFNRDAWKIKMLVYLVFTLEILQTVIRSVDRWEIDVMLWGNPAGLDAILMDWFSTPVLTAVTSGLVQAYFGYRLYVFSKSWLIAGIIWTLTLLQCVAGIIFGAFQAGRSLHEVATNGNITKAFLVWIVTTAVTDVMIAGLLTYYLRMMRGGFKETDRMVSNIIRLTVETGALTAVTAILILVLYLTCPPWFLVPGDVLGKLYSNNLMVMFNRRINFSRSQGTTMVSAPTTPGVIIMDSSTIDELGNARKA